MYCKSCGKQIDDDSIFCTFCGTRQSIIYKPDPNTSFAALQSKSMKVDLSSEIPSTIKSTSEVNIKPPKYDLSYEKEADATFAGMFLILISIVFAVIGPMKFDTEDSYNQFKVISTIGALFVRIIGTIWVVNITRRQNRDPFLWGLLTLIFPSIGLIIVGQLKKLYNPNEHSNSRTTEENISPTDLEKNNNEPLNLGNIKLTKLPEAKLTNKDVIKNDSEYLIKLLKEYPHSLISKNYPDIVPLYVFQELNKRKVLIDNEMLSGLEQFARRKGFNNFDQMLKYYQ
jgi:hypothetical protein